MKLAILFGLLQLSFSLGAITTSSYYTATDKSYAKRLLQESFTTSDVASIHYAALGLKRLAEALPASTTQCKLVIDTASDPKASPETLYHAVVAHKAIGTCTQPLPVVSLVKSLNSILDKATTLQEIFFATQALTALGQKPADPSKVLKTAQSILRKNDSLANFGYFFHISAALGPEGASSFDRIEDAIVQADEVDSKFLQFEGGLSTTALIINGAFKLANSLNKPPPISYEQAVKFANYFLSRRSVQTPKGIANLLQALINLSNNKFHVPVAISLASNPSLSVDSPRVSVKVSTVMGTSLGSISVVADSATRAADDVVILSKKKFDATSDSTVFNLNLLESKPDRGQYKLTVSASVDKPDPRIPAAVSSTVTVKVLCEAVVDFLDIGVVDADQTTQGKLTRVAYPKISDKLIEGDAQQKIQMRFSVKEKGSSKSITVHQAFLRLNRPGSSDSVIFIAEPDSNSQYRLDLDLGAKSADFNHISGEYDAELIIGDAVLVNSFAWRIAKLNLKFSAEPKLPQVQDAYKPKPEIKHLFREPEKRPPRFVSDLFSILAAFPLLLLLVLWASLKVNVSNLSLSLSTLVFHVSLGAIFVLFGLFWLKFNMFETIRYLIGVGVIAFFSGNSVLRNISAKRK